MEEHSALGLSLSPVSAATHPHLQPTASVWPEPGPQREMAVAKPCQLLRRGEKQRNVLGKAEALAWGGGVRDARLELCMSLGYPLQASTKLRTSQPGESRNGLGWKGPSKNI